MYHKPSVLFISLTTFQGMGGIEKFNKAFLKALSELKGDVLSDVTGISLYDTTVDERYFPEASYYAGAGKRISAILKSLRWAAKADIIILGHINLALVGSAIKALYPKKKIWLTAHGIDVWEQQTGLKKQVLNIADRILAVSDFTKTKMAQSNQLEKSKISIFHNCIDPFFEYPDNFEKPEYLQKRYKVDQDKVLYTLTRLNSGEKYKGYDKVIEALPILRKEFPGIKYIIGGKGDEQELARVKQLIKENDVEENVILAGFIPDEEVTDHYKLADAFVMPSKGEGFGIVFIEAAASGANVIAGNKDGSTDALANGELGTLVDPEDVNALAIAIRRNLIQHNHSGDIQQKTKERFAYTRFAERLRENIITV
jgi:phosphatidylinositol alpha-1,6-mannosyltransferase